MPYRLYQVTVVDESRAAATIEVALPEALGGEDPRLIRERLIRSGEVIIRWDTDGVVPDVRRNTRRVLHRALQELAAQGSTASIDLVYEEPSRTLRPGFVEYILENRLVPFERSPLIGESLVSLASGGFVAVMEFTTAARDPVLWIEAAGAITVIGVLKKVGMAVGDVGADAIRYHLPRLLRIPTRRRSRSRRQSE